MQSYLANIFKRNENINGKDAENLCGKKRCEIKFRKSKEEIEKLNHFYSIGYMDLCFGDASHFSTVPNVPYAWQTKDEPILLPSVRSKSVSVLRLMMPCSKLFD